MKRLSKEQILMLHTQLIFQTGGISGVRDMNLLESAMEAPFQSFEGEELYPTIQAKGARLGYGFIKKVLILSGIPGSNISTLFLVKEYHTFFFDSAALSCRGFKMLPASFAAVTESLRSSPSGPL